jgi:hypothetical protein
MRASLLRGGRRPAPGNLVLQDLLSYTSLYKLVTRLLEVKTATFSGDSSRKWRSLWSVLENLDWNLQGYFGAEECLDLFENIVLFTRQQSL